MSLVPSDATFGQQLAALAGETRLRILRALQRGVLRCRRSRCDLTAHCCNVSELAEELELSLPTVSHHLKELRRAGLVRMERQGKFVNVSLRGEALQRLAAELAALARHGPRPPATRL